MISLGLGLVLGSMLGSLTYCIALRSLTKKTFFGRSYCESCKHTLSWYDLFPIFSYLFLRGRCRYCKHKISPEYFLYELLSAGLIALLFAAFLPDSTLLKMVSVKSLADISNLYTIVALSDLLFKAFLVCVFLAVLITDLKTYLIPDRITYPAIAITFIWLLISTIAKIGLLYFGLVNSVLGRYLVPPYSDYFYRHSLSLAEPLMYGFVSAFGIALFFGSLIWLTKGRGMGGGDLKLGFLMGLGLGFPNSLLALMLAFLSGSIVGVILLIMKRKHFGQVIPFGPFLSLGSIVALLYGQAILNWYVTLRLF